jgi:hypothetical protein
MMSRHRTIRLSLLATGALFTLVLSSSLASAQCAMCRTGLNGSPDAMRVAQQFNFAVLVLLIPPVLLFCGFFLLMLRFRKSQGETVLGARDEIKSLIRVWRNKINARRKGQRQKRRESKGALA